MCLRESSLEWMFQREICLLVFLGGAISPFSAWLFTKAKGLVWRRVAFVSSTPLAAPSVLRGHLRDSVLKVLVLWGEGWRRYGCVGEVASIGDPLSVIVCGAGCPISPTKWLLLLKDKPNLENDHMPEANSRGFW